MVLAALRGRSRSQRETGDDRAMAAVGELSPIRPITREELAIRAITREEMEHHIARAEALRHAAYAAAFAAAGRSLRRVFYAISRRVVWTAAALRPTSQITSTGEPRHGNCRA